MNNRGNNNNNNNRRRGRGNNNRPQGGGGGQQLNRVDSRARGNAPQLLEKYRKLAQDAHLNGDRVTAEYFLQFADHYFRVLADARLRQEEQRGGARQNERWQEQDGESENGSDDGDFGMDADFPGFDQQQPRQEPRRDEPRGERERPDRNERAEREPRRERAESDGEAGERDGNRASRNPDELIANPSDNPFVRDNRTTRQGRPRQAERAAPVAQDVLAQDGGERAEEAAPAEAQPQAERPARGRGGLRPRRDAAERARDAEQSGLDPASLPPAIGGVRAEPAEVTEAPAAEAAPRRRTRRLAPRNDDAGDTLEAVNG